MEEEFYCVLKLVSGEEILSVVSADNTTDETLLILQNPVTMKMVQASDGNSYLKMQSWMQLTEEDMFIIKLDKVITMTEISDEKLISIYQNYFADEVNPQNPQELGGKVKVSNEMGYISSVKDARNKLEDIFKGIKES
jgi:hypothetical protein